MSNKNAIGEMEARCLKAILLTLADRVMDINRFGKADLSIQLKSWDDWSTPMMIDMWAGRESSTPKIVYGWTLQLDDFYNDRCEQIMRDLDRIAEIGWEAFMGTHVTEVA